MFSSWFTNPHRPREIAQEEEARKKLALLRSREFLMTVLCIWLVFLGMVFTSIATVRLALLTF